MTGDLNVRACVRVCLGVVCVYGIDVASDVADQPQTLGGRRQNDEHKRLYPVAGPLMLP